MLSDVVGVRRNGRTVLGASDTGDQGRHALHVGAPELLGRVHEEVKLLEIPKGRLKLFAVDAVENDSHGLSQRHGVAHAVRRVNRRDMRGAGKDIVGSPWFGSSQP